MFQVRFLRLACVIAAFAVLGGVGQTVAAQTNVALGRPYTMSPRPNYGLTADAGDDTQLTDGAITTNNPIWTRASTVGWSNATLVTIVLDLQSVKPIAGVSFSTAAGKAGVSWPRSIFLLTSDDGKQFYPAGDLTSVDSQRGPPASGYVPYHYAINTLQTHGRYVAFVIDPVGPYLFCDEIEVTSGDPAWLAQPLTGESTTNLQNYFTLARMRMSIARRLASDIEDARIALSASSADDDLRASLSAALDEAALEIPGLPSVNPSTFTTVLPLSDLHARIFAVQGAIARADGLPPLSAWAVNPWDYARPVERPQPGEAGPVIVAAMNGERRAGAVDLFNATADPISVSVRLTDATGGPGEFDVQLYDVQWTDTRDLIPVADALVPVAADTQWTLPAGMTRQVWLSFSPQDRAPGIYRGFVEVRTGDAIAARVPIELTVLVGTFPSRPSLHVGGWDYTDRQSYMGLTPANSAALVEQLHALNVDSTWATASVLGAGTFDATGRLAQLPDTTLFDRWTARWPGASQYCVFLNARGALGGISTSSPNFAGAVGQWITFWVAHAAQLGIQPHQLVLLVADEPSTPAQDDQITTWATAIKAAQPSVTLWEDPWFTTPATATPRMLQTIDVVTLGRLLVAQPGSALVDFYRNWALTAGRALNVYGSSGPVRLLDPYTYHRLQAWICARLGATGSFFWSFSDDANGASWNEYRLPATQATFSPFFLSNAQVTISKHSEAIREGMEDFEYLNALRGMGDAAGTLFDTALSTVLEASDLQWTTSKDRTAADSMRMTIAGALGWIPPPPPPPPETPTPVLSDEGSLDGRDVPGASEPPVAASESIAPVEVVEASEPVPPEPVTEPGVVQIVVDALPEIEEPEGVDPPQP